MGFSRKNTKIIGLTGLLLLLFISSRSQRNLVVKDFSSVICGDSQFDKYLPLLKNKRVAVITNITGVIGTTSIVDTLLKLKVDIKKIFGPEHGFRSDIDAGEKVSSNIDQQTGLPIVSLYGSNKKPSKEQLSDVDVVIYDIQDIGVRFYTYISTMCYAMEACAENKKEFIVLDRPNPNGFYIDGPVMKNEFKSFLGLHNVPLVYGMTCGEYAQMVNG
ncbi:MAG: exo-beta-N-acetylmuramidase NamZ family protein, partial [Bacteroidia bacterium]